MDSINIGTLFAPKFLSNFCPYAETFCDMEKHDFEKSNASRSQVSNLVIEQTCLPHNDHLTCGRCFDQQS